MASCHHPCFPDETPQSFFGTAPSLGRSSENAAPNAIRNATSRHTPQEANVVVRSPRCSICTDSRGTVAVSYLIHTWRDAVFAQSVRVTPNQMQIRLFFLVCLTCNHGRVKLHSKHIDDFLLRLDDIVFQL